MHLKSNIRKSSMCNSLAFTPSGGFRSYKSLEKHLELWAFILSPEECPQIICLMSWILISR